jgi:hypothetical protein
MVALCNIHDELTKRSDLPLLAADLGGSESVMAGPHGAPH